MADLGDPQPEDGTGARRSERAAAIVSELADAFAAAVRGLAEEERLLMAERVLAIAEAARSAARSLDRSGSPELARGIDRTADRIGDFSRMFRERSWRDIAAETEEFARQRPGLFGFGVVALGFVLGRLLLLPAARDGPVEAAAKAEPDAGRAAPGRQKTL